MPATLFGKIVSVGAVAASLMLRDRGRRPVCLASAKGIIVIVGYAGSMEYTVWGNLDGRLALDASAGTLQIA